MDRVGHRALREDLLFYLQDLWRVSVVNHVKDSNIIIVNDDTSLLGALRDAEGVKRPFIFLSTSRRHSVLTETMKSVHTLGGLLRVVFKPCRPSHLFDAVRDCIRFLRQTAAIDTVPYCPQPSPPIGSFPSQACPSPCPIQTHPSPPPLSPRRGSGTNLEVLVVEDNHVNRALLTQWLQKKVLQHLWCRSFQLTVFIRIICMMKRRMGKWQLTNLRREVRIIMSQSNNHSDLPVFCA